MTRLSSFTALPGAIVRTLAFFRQNVLTAAIVAILPGLAAIALTYKTGAITSPDYAPDWGLYLLALAAWYVATAMAQTALFRIALRGKPSGLFGVQIGSDELKLGLSWALVFFLIFIAGGIMSVAFAAFLGAVSMVSQDDSGLAPEDPVVSGNIPELWTYYGAAEWTIAILVGGLFLILLGGFAGRLLLAPAASIARRKVQALAVMAMTEKRGFAVVFGAILCFVPAGLLVHGFGVLADQLFTTPVHQPARLFAPEGLVSGWAVYAPLAFVHGWLAAFLTTPLFVGLTAALYRAWGGDE